jgi:hypothetical protein
VHFAPPPRVFRPIGAPVRASKSRKRSAGRCRGGLTAKCRSRISLSRDPGYKAAMSTFFSHWLVPIAIGAVAVVLLLGLLNMMRGGSGNTSQKLMRLRVLLQFVAIVIIMFTIWVTAK